MDDYISIKPYKPPPQVVVSGKKRDLEALAEAAKHHFRGTGYMAEEQREGMMRCMAQSRRLFKEVAMSIYGTTFVEVARFLDGGQRRRSVWQRAREKLANKQKECDERGGGGGGGGKEKAAAATDDNGGDGGASSRLMALMEQPPGVSTLLPCAVIYPNMHATDRPELLKLLLTAVQQDKRRSRSGAATTDTTIETDTDALPPIGCTIRSTCHTTLASILRDLYLQIMAAVESLPTQARGGRRSGSAAGGGFQRGRGGYMAPQGTLGEVLSAYNLLVEGLTFMAGNSTRNTTSSSFEAFPAPPPPPPPRPALLLLFEDVEALNNRLLEDLLRLLAEASSTVPSRLVFLVSPAFSLAQNLGNGATATLEPATFVLPPAQLCFEKLLERLFLDVELPVMVSGQMLRFFRVTFLEMHNSITTFIRHLDFMLRLHFHQLKSLLCLMPYDMVPEAEVPLLAVATTASAAAAAAAAAAPVSQEERVACGGGGGDGAAGGAGGAAPPPASQESLSHQLPASSSFVSTASQGAGAASSLDGTTTTSNGSNNSGGAQVLVLTKAEGGIHDSHNLMVLRHLDALTKLPAVRAMLTKLLASSNTATATGGAASSSTSSSSAAMDDRSKQFQCLRILVYQQLANRFELRIGCHLIYQGLIERCPPTNRPTDIFHLLEVLLDYDRPQRWRTFEQSLFEGLAATSLEDLEGLVLAWLEALRTLVEQMPAYVRRFSKAINQWISRARELWLLLKALGKEMARKAKQQRRKSSHLRKSSGSKGENNTGGGGGGGDSTGAAAAQQQQQQQQQQEMTEKERAEEEEDRRLYRLKTQGLIIDAQAFIADVITHCTKTLGQSSSYFKEAFWYCDSQSIQEVFFAQPRASAVRALNDSQSYLKCQCCHPGELDPSMPDICIVYSLYEAYHGRTIPIRRWFASFVDVICGEEEEEEEEEEEDTDTDEDGEEEEEEEEDGDGPPAAKRAKKAKTQDKKKKKKKKTKNKKKKGGKKSGGTSSVGGRNLKALWARFLHAVDELEHLGFTKHYGKKGDRTKLMFAYTLLSRRRQEQEEGQLLLNQT